MGSLFAKDSRATGGFKRSIKGEEADNEGASGRKTKEHIATYAQVDTTVCSLKYEHTRGIY